MEITIFGTALIILGYVGVLASFSTLAAVSPGDESSQKYPVLRFRNVVIAIVTSIILVILGFVIIDPRRISDSLALFILGGSLVAIVAFLLVMAVVGVRAGGHKAGTIDWGLRQLAFSGWARHPSLKRWSRSQHTHYLLACPLRVMSHGGFSDT